MLQRYWISVKTATTFSIFQKCQEKSINNRLNHSHRILGVKEVLWPTLITTYGLKDSIHLATFIVTLTRDDLFILGQISYWKSFKLT